MTRSLLLSLVLSLLLDAAVRMAEHDAAFGIECDGRPAARCTHSKSRTTERRIAGLPDA
jgi:hypothetical protein